MPSKKIKKVFNVIKDELEKVSSDPEWELFTGFSHSIKNFVGLEKETTAWEKSLTDFKKLRSHQERIKSILDDGNTPKLIASLACELFEERGKIDKCSSKAKEYREQGNKEFAKKRYQSALELYSEAVNYAPKLLKDSTQNNEYALAFANRSASLFHLQRYEDCLNDVEESLENGYPFDRRQILLTRKILCHRALNQQKQLDQLMEKLKSEDAEWYKKNEDFLSAALTQDFIKPVEDKRKELLMQIAESHENLPGASNCLKVEQSKEKGRYIVATRDIDPSEILFSEQPYCSWLKPSLYSDFCYHCMKWLNRCQTPCLSCTLVRYCSKACRQEAWTLYHEKECSHMDILKPLGTGHMALRMVMIAGVENALQASQTKTVQDNSATLYEKILSLVDNSRNHVADSIYSHAAGAIFMTVLAHKIGVLTINEQNYTPFAALILKHLLQIRCNTCSVLFDEMEPINGHQRLSSTSLKTTGCAIYPSISLLNHACDIKVYPLFSGSKQVIKAVDTIRAGEEVTLNYGVLHKKLTKKERQMILQQQYFFECKCKFCESGQEFLGLACKCPKCEGPLFMLSDNTSSCSKCGRREMPNLRKKHQEVCQLLQQGNELYQSGKTYESRDTFLRCLEEAKELLWPENELLAEIHEKLGRLFFVCEDYKASLKHWSASFNIVRGLHGEENYDALSCLLNLAYILMESGKNSHDVKKMFENSRKSKKYFDKAVSICNKLVGREYCVLSAREEALKDIELIPEVGRDLQDLFG